MSQRRGRIVAVAVVVSAVAVFVGLSATALCDVKQSPATPNIVFILADDLGYGDLGCYGQTKIKTPAIDRLASAGMRFTRHYSGSAVCAPARCVLMTGFHPGHAPIRDNREVQPEGQSPLPDGTCTLPQRLRECGYVCGLFGKWGLGSPDSSSAPLRAGFDRFFGYNCQRAAHSFYPERLWDNDQTIIINSLAIPGHQRFPDGADSLDPALYARYIGSQYSADLIAAATRRFVAEHRDRPFFLYWATTVPHLALQVPDDSLADYRGEFAETPYNGNRGYLPHKTPRAAYAAMISRLDAEVGRLVETLRAEGVLDNTLIVFTSDNGPPPDQLGGTNTEFFNSHANFRGRKGDLYEGGIRVPCVVSWQGVIRGGTVADRLSGFEDWMPTLLEITASPAPLSANLVTDGVSLRPTLCGEESSPRQFLYREFPGYGGQQAIWTDEWKAIRTKMQPAAREGKTLADIPLELYRLAEDPHEATNVANDHPGVIEHLEKLMRSAHTPNPLFPLPLVD